MNECAARRRPQAFLSEEQAASKARRRRGFRSAVAAVAAGNRMCKEAKEARPRPLCLQHPQF
jgi:hypothetical protein